MFQTHQILKQNFNVLGWDIFPINFEKIQFLTGQAGVISELLRACCFSF